MVMAWLTAVAHAGIDRVEKGGMLYPASFNTRASVWAGYSAEAILSFRVASTANSIKLDSGSIRGDRHSAGILL